MTRPLQTLNLVLLVVLGGLCVVQWTREKNYTSKIEELQRTASRQSDKIAEQEESIRLTKEDIEGFKTDVAAQKSKIDEQNVIIRQDKARIFSLEAENEKLTKRGEALNQNIESFKSAVTGRDENIKILIEQRDQLVAANKDAAGKANQAITAYNELSGKYEELVTHYNTLAARYKAEREEGDLSASNRNP
ncbi:MAG: hypothetical protein WC378_04810 [Opitutaceae bacterium]|jgi:chromosome segregation ATPase